MHLPGVEKSNITLFRPSRIMFRMADALQVDVLHPNQHDLYNIFLIYFHLILRWNC